MGLVLSLLYCHFKLRLYALRWVFGIIITLLFFFVGKLCQEFNKEIDLPPSISMEHPVAWVGQVEKIQYTGEEIKSIEVIVNRVKIDSIWEQTNFNLLVYGKELNVDLWENDVIATNSYFHYPKSPQNPVAFDYQSYLQRKNIYYTTFIRDIEVDKTLFGIKKLASKIREGIYQTYKSLGIQGNELAVLTALTLGDKSQLNPNISGYFAQAGAMHILAVSGLHVGIIYFIISFLLQLIPNTFVGKWVKAISLLFAIWSFAFISGLSPSVQRASCMFSFVAIEVVLNRNSNIVNSIAASALFLISIEPNVVYQLGFQLSYTAVFGIVVLYQPLYKLITVKFWLLKRIWKLLAVSIAAQLATLPFVVFYFHQFPNLFWLTNLVVIPMVFVVVGLVVVCSVPFLLFDSHFMLGGLLNLVLRGLNYSIELIAQLPFAVSDNLWINKLSYVFLLLCVIAFVGFIRLARVRWLMLGLFFMLCFFISETYDLFDNNRKQEITIYHSKKPIFSFSNHSEAMIYYNFTDPVAEKELHRVQEHMYNEGKKIIQEVNLSKSPFVQVGNKLVLVTNKAMEINLFSPLVNVILFNSDSLKGEFFVTKETAYIDYGNKPPNNLTNKNNVYKLQEQGCLKVLLK